MRIKNTAIDFITNQIGTRFSKESLNVKQIHTSKKKTQIHSNLKS